MRKMGNMVEDIDQLRREREARKNPPEFEAGQGEDDGGWDFFSDEGGSNMDESAFGGSSQGSGTDFGGMGSDLSSLGGSVQGGFSNTQQPNNANLTSTEDKVIEGVVVVGKYTWKGLKELFDGIHKGIQGNDAFYWTVYGKKVMFTGLWVTGGGAILSLLGLVTTLSNGFWVFIGGLFCVAVGVLVFCLNCEKASEIGHTVEKEPEVIFEDTEEDSNSEDIWGNLEEQEEGNGWGSYSEDAEEYGEEEEYDPWSSINEDNYSEEKEEVIVSNEPIDIDSAIENITEIPAHTQTRQYLFEEFSKVLPVKSPNFSNLVSISENNDEFILFDKRLRDASIQVGTKEEKIPELLELRENDFIIQIIATRPSGLKEEEIANEIAIIYSRDDYGLEIRSGVYATTSSVGGSYIINLFKGTEEGDQKKKKYITITLADSYRVIKDFILDPTVKKPVVMGVNEFGRVWYFDAEKVFSYIISGKPRSGKSWSVVSLVLQLCMYSSPKEINFEIFDVKNASSDYYNMQGVVPHIKRFESNAKRIIQRLRQIVTVEKARREAILKENGVISIADLKEKNLEADLPYLYVLIDEIIGLKKAFTKEEDSEFKELVNVMITLMPNVGVRLILVPHRVTNDIIPKTTYTNVGCIACVRSDSKEISNTLDVTKKEFPYDVVNTGDMALKTSEVNSGKAVFCHGIALTPSNDENVGIYRFIGSLWNKLEPEVKEDITEKTSRKGEYKGHNLAGTDSFDEYSSEDDVNEDFWKEYLGDS